MTDNTANTNSQQESSKSSSEKRLLLFNAFLGAVLIVTQIAAAVVLDWRARTSQAELAKIQDERARTNQLELAKLQDELARKNQLELARLQDELARKTALETAQQQARLAREDSQARLEVLPGCFYITSCSGAILIKNTGKAAAKNAKIVIGIETISEAWRSVVTDINQFTIKTLSPELNIDSKQIKIANRYQLYDVPGNNALELNVSNIPPDASVQVLFSRPQLADEQTVTITSPVIMTLVLPQESRARAYPSGLVTTLLQQYLEQTFSIVTLQTTTSCDNCVGSGIGIRTFIGSDGPMAIWDNGALREDSQVYVWHGTLSVKYALPKGVGAQNFTSPLNLRVLNPDSGQRPTIEVIAP